MIWRFDKKQSKPLPPSSDSAPPQGNGAFGQLVAALPDPVVILDGNGLVLRANDRARELLLTLTEGQHVAQSIRAPTVLAAVEDVLLHGGSQQVDYEVRMPVLRHFEVLVASMRGHTAKDPAILVILKDLTREQQIERTRSDFVANASHELRTPLASLSGFIETLQGAAKDDPKARGTFLDLMRSQADRMKRLIDDLLSLSRIEMNAHLRPSTKVDLVLVTLHVADMLSIMAKDYGVAIAIDLPPKLEVQGDWDELVQVVLNLVENAMKYASTGKRIEITGSMDDQLAKLTIRDFGPGIAPEHLPRLTERFYRISVQESRSRGGTGLGLAIVKHILNRHRGRLLVSSELGVGTVVDVKLPLAKP